MLLKHTNFIREKIKLLLSYEKADMMVKKKEGCDDDEPTN